MAIFFSGSIFANDDPERARTSCGPWHVVKYIQVYSRFAGSFLLFRKVLCLALVEENKGQGQNASWGSFLESLSTKSVGRKKMCRSSLGNVHLDNLSVD